MVGQRMLVRALDSAQRRLCIFTRILQVRSGLLAEFDIEAMIRDPEVTSIARSSKIYHRGNVRGTGAEWKVSNWALSETVQQHGRGDEICKIVRRRIAMVVREPGLRDLVRNLDCPKSLVNGCHATLRHIWSYWDFLFHYHHITLQELFCHFPNPHGKRWPATRSEIAKAFRVKTF
jgi:hypothetical protein